MTEMGQYRYPPDERPPADIIESIRDECLFGAYRLSEGSLAWLLNVADAALREFRLESQSAIDWRSLRHALFIDKPAAMQSRIDAWLERARAQENGDNEEGVS